MLGMIEMNIKIWKNYLVLVGLNKVIVTPGVQCNYFQHSILRRRERGRFYLVQEFWFTVNRTDHS